MHSADDEGFENARAEYSAAHDAYLHYDDFTWRVGTVLVAGVFVYWGLLIEHVPDFAKLCGGNLLVCLCLAPWALYGVHNRQIYRFKLERIYELEQFLGMEQHRRFHPKEDVARRYNLTGFRGHHLIQFIYFIASLGGLAFGLLSPDYGTFGPLEYELLGLNFIVVFVVFYKAYSVAKSTDKRLEDAGGRYPPPAKSG